MPQLVYDDNEDVGYKEAGYTVKIPTTSILVGNEPETQCVRCDFRWTVVDYKQLWRRYEPDQKFSSFQFRCAPNCTCDHLWRINLYPRGKRFSRHALEPKEISVFLELVSGQEETSITMSWVLSTKSGLVLKQIGNKAVMFQEKKAWGYDRFYPMEDLVKQRQQTFVFELAIQHPKGSDNIKRIWNRRY